MKGYYFTADALVALSFMMLISMLFWLPHQTPIILSDTVASDFVAIMQDWRIGDVNQSWVLPLIANGSITQVNQSVLEQLGEFYALGQLGLAQELIEQTIAKHIPSQYGFGIWVDSSAMYINPKPVLTQQSSAWRLISGIEEEKPIRGHIARASATKVVAVQKLIETISPMGAGWHNGNVSIVKYINLSNVTILSAMLQTSLHADMNLQGVRIRINNDTCNYAQNTFTWWFGGSDANVARRNITSCLVNGMNSVNITLRRSGYNSHTHPGTLIEVDYSADVPLVVEEKKQSTKYLLTDITSREVSPSKAGAWMMIPFEIPLDATNITVRTVIHLENVTNYVNVATNGCVRTSGACNGNAARQHQFVDWNNQWRNAANSDVIAFLNINQPFYINGTVSQNMTLSFTPQNLSALIRNGTNILSIYVNNYIDSSWGAGLVKIVSVPGIKESYVEVNYTRAIVQPYGMIKLSNVTVFGGAEDYDKTVSFSYPAQALVKSDAYLYLIQRYSNMMDAWAGVTSPPTIPIFSSPSVRAVPTNLFIDRSNLELNSLISNYVRVYDTGMGSNNFLPNSTIQATYYVPSSVDFGEVFATEALAQADALNRLATAMGPLVSATSITTDASSIQSVPSLWGPLVVEVRVWH